MAASEAKMAETIKENNRGKLILFTGVSTPLDLFMGELRTGFEGLGYEVMMFDMADQTGSVAALTDFMKDPVKAAISFNSAGMLMRQNDGVSVWDAHGIPMITILVDHPVFFGRMFASLPASGIVLTIDKKHMEFIQRFYPKAAVTGFLPHGGFMPKCDIKPVAGRSIDVLFAGSTHGDPDLLPKEVTQNMDSGAAALGDAIMQEMCGNDSLTLEAAVENVVRRAGHDLSDEQLLEVISYYDHLQLAAAFSYREKMLMALAQNGVRVTLYGSGWDKKALAKHPCIDYRGTASPQEILEAMQDSKIVLTTMTWFKDGSHERVFNGMLAGAVVVSDTSGYLEDEFTEDEIVTFRLSEIDALPGRIRELLGDEGRMQSIACAGRKKAEAKHTWQERAGEISADLLQILTF